MMTARAEPFDRLEILRVPRDGAGGRHAVAMLV
jgi:hypothetical protein